MEENGEQTAQTPPVRRSSVVNFRTGTYLRETSQDLKGADYFISNPLNFPFQLGKIRPVLSFRRPSGPKKRSLRLSSSSPSVRGNSSCDNLILCEEISAGSLTSSLHPNGSSLFVIPNDGTQETFFDVVSEAAKESGLSSSLNLIFGNSNSSNSTPTPSPTNSSPMNLVDQTITCQAPSVTSQAPPVTPLSLNDKPSQSRGKGYLRKGLREKLALKAELARAQVQAQKLSQDQNHMLPKTQPQKLSQIQSQNLVQVKVQKLACIRSEFEPGVVQNGVVQCEDLIEGQSSNDKKNAVLYDCGSEKGAATEKTDSGIGSESLTRIDSLESALS